MSRIAIAPSRPLGAIDRKVFGGFVEHLGRCIYGGLYEEGSPLSDERGFRKDVLAWLRDLRLGTLRWPGGNFASNYHWQDGIGPKDARPRRPELAWGGEEPNRFGTDEFLAYCAELGTEPYICLNMGTGTLEEALAWVEYCNSAANTYWAARRRDNGHPEPYRVKYWALGNEMYGAWQVGAMSAEEYVREAARWARAIRIERTAYLQSVQKMPRIAYDEWNVWYRVMTVDLAERYTWDDALAVATYLNIFIRHSDWVKMANLAQMVNAIAPIVATPETAVVQPVYYPVLLHARAALDMAVDVHVEGETVEPELRPAASRWPYHVGDFGPFTLVDAAATVSVNNRADVSASNRQIAVTLVNRALSAEPVRIVLRDFAFDGSAAITTVTAGGAAEPRTLPDVATAHLQEGSEHAVGGAVELTLPPQSFTVIEAPIAAS